MYFASIRLRTRHEFAAAVARDKDFLRCWVALSNRESREESDASGNYSAGHIPAAIARLSPDLHAVRMVFTDGGRKSNHDRMYIFDAAKLVVRELFFTCPAGTPITRELQAAKAAVRGLR